MIIMTESANPTALCLTNDIFEYRKHRRLVRAPMATIDLHEGKIMAGPMKKEIQYSSVLSDVGALTVEDSQYRYLTFNEDSRSRWIISVGAVKLGQYIRVDYGVPKLEVVARRHDTLEMLMFRGLRETIIEDVREWVKTAVSYIVLNGRYTDKPLKVDLETTDDLI